ncbi:hypothetical protein Tco_0256317 [Tanacetum coccineum]
MDRSKRSGNQRAPNDRRENIERSRKSSWDNNRGQKGRDRFSPYRGPNHGLLSSLSKIPREILAIEKAARSFEQPPRMFGSRRSRDVSKYYHFHEDHGHETNYCRQLRNQIEEAMKSGQLSHLVKEIKKERVKVSENQRVEGKKDKGNVPAEAPILMIRRDESYTKNNALEGFTSEGREITFPLRAEAHARGKSWSSEEIPLEITIGQWFRDMYSISLKCKLSLTKIPLKWRGLRVCTSGFGFASFVSQVGMALEHLGGQFDWAVGAGSITNVVCLLDVRMAFREVVCRFGA